MPIEPAAPGWLATNDLLAPRCVRPSATIRAITSGAPPAPVVTISFDRGRRVALGERGAPTEGERERACADRSRSSSSR